MRWPAPTLAHPSPTQHPVRRGIHKEGPHTPQPLRASKSHPGLLAASSAQHLAVQASGCCVLPRHRSPVAWPGQLMFQGAPWPAAGSLGEERWGMLVGPSCERQDSQCGSTALQHCGAVSAAPFLPCYWDEDAAAQASTGKHHSPAYALALALEARVPWDNGRVFTIRCFMLRASRATGREQLCLRVGPAPGSGHNRGRDASPLPIPR